MTIYKSDLDEKIKNMQPINMAAEEERAWDDAIESAVACGNLTVSTILESNPDTSIEK